MHTFEGPECIYVSCHRMPYKECVKHFILSHFAKVDNAILDQIKSTKFTSSIVQEAHWICTTCKHAILRNHIPAQAKCNGLQLPQIPTQENLHAETVLNKWII